MSAPRKHGESCYRGHRASPEYQAWLAMKKRTSPSPSNPRDKAIYFDRGVTVCERWRDSYEAFLQDMGRRPGPGYSLDRVDGNQGYSPSNCRWATWKEQNTNKKGVRIVEVNGARLCVAEWARVLGISRVTLGRRLKRSPSAVSDLISGVAVLPGRRP